jgi:hypothetical protein
MTTTKFILISLLLTLIGCDQKSKNVIVTEFDLDKTIKSKEVLQFHLQQTDSLLKYRVTGDSNSILIWFPFDKPVNSDSVIYAWDMTMKLVDTKNYTIDGIANEVLKYEYKDGMDGDMTLFLNEFYGPVIVRSDAFGGYITYDRPDEIRRKLIELIKNDSIDFGGI